MAWTAPRTWNIGELVTKVIMDTHIRDNLNYLASTMEVWVPVTAAISTTNYPILSGHYGFVRLSSLNDEAVCVFRCPDNYGSIVTAKMIVSPVANQATANWDIETLYAAEGELINNHNEADAATTYNVIQDTYYGVDFSGILTALAAGDIVHCTILLADAIHDLSVYGFRFVYNIA